MPSLRSLSFCALVLCLSLATFSCGGSGGSNNNPPPPPTYDFIYTANAAGSTGTVSALTTNTSTGALAAISGSPFSAGNAPRSMTSDSAGKFLYVGNYLSSNISAFGINASTGALTAVSGSPFAAELGIDAVALAPSSTFLYAVSERSANVSAYSVNANGALTPLVGYPDSLLAPATAADSVIVDPGGKYVFTGSRGAVNGYIHGFSINTSGGISTNNGSLTALAGFPLTAPGLPVRLAFDPAGKFLIVAAGNAFSTNGGVTVYSLSSGTGALTAVGSSIEIGPDPSGVVVDSTGKFVYITNTGNATISAFQLDATGGLTAITGSPFASGGAGSINGPTGITTDNAGKFVYVSNASNDISVFAINSTTGALTAVTGSPFATGNGPSAIVWVNKP